MEEIQEQEEGHLMMGGDFNARRKTGDQERRKKKREDQRTRR